MSTTERPRRFRSSGRRRRRDHHGEPPGTPPHDPLDRRVDGRIDERFDLESTRSNFAILLAGFAVLMAAVAGVGGSSHQEGPAPDHRRVDDGPAGVP
jgi:hypothetical protein